MAFEHEELDLEDGPVIFEEGDHTVGIRLLEDDEPEALKGYVVEISLWVRIDGTRFQVGSAFVDREARDVEVWVDENENLDDEPAYVKAIHRFDEVVRTFVQSSRALMDLDRDLNAWLEADPGDPFKGSSPADDPIDYAKLSPVWHDPDDIHAIMAEFGVSIEDGGIIHGINSLTDEERQKMYVKLRRLKRREENNEEDW